MKKEDLSKSITDEDFKIGYNVVYEATDGYYYKAKILTTYENDLIHIKYDVNNDNSFAANTIAKKDRLFKSKSSGFTDSEEVIYVQNPGFYARYYKANILGSYENSIFEIRYSSSGESYITIVIKEPKLLKLTSDSGFATNEKVIYVQDPGFYAKYYKANILGSYEEEVFEISYNERKAIRKNPQLFKIKKYDDFEIGDEVKYTGYSTTYDAKILESYENDIFEISYSYKGSNNTKIVTKDKLQK